MLIGNKDFEINKRAYIMGILNVTPDSFSDGGKFNNTYKALQHAEQMILEGAAIIDVGGESTRPNYIAVSAEEEIERVVPIIKELKKQFDVPISIDTYKSEVAKAALEAGVDIINDIWGLKYDPKMALVVKEYNVPICLMHNRKDMNYNLTIQKNSSAESKLLNMTNKKEDSIGLIPDEFMTVIKSDINECIDLALEAGISKDKIIIDPGIGFAKTYEMNLILMNRLEELSQFGYPILLGTSRKSMIGLTLDEPSQNRLEGTIATSVMGVMKGCSFFRVHDVLANYRAVKMTEVIRNERKL